MILDTRELTNYLFLKFRNLPMQPKELWNEITNYEDEEEEKTINLQELVKEIKEGKIPNEITPKFANALRLILLKYDFESKEYIQYLENKHKKKIFYFKKFKEE